ncbi:hypothetical protein [Blastococcus litoris]|uniref:hypothetical protein n=1 Tax=Blastococcus litoris TaxID=2171622 RepID=UPI000E2FFF83|nr:hypothetical protein [Blastococcus litoris]
MSTMETMHAAGRRSLPPVPRSGVQPTPAAAELPGDTEVPTERFVVDLTTGEQHAVQAATVADPEAAGPSEDGGPDLAQQFVARLRAAAADFAEAAGAVSAVVREAVPPARHRRARCRLVLRHADEALVDVTFLGPAGEPGRPSRHGFDRQIRRWLLAGQRRDDAWLVADPDASDGLAVDLSAWTAAA